MRIPKRELKGLVLIKLLLTVVIGIPKRELKVLKGKGAYGYAVKLNPEEGVESPEEAPP